MAPTARSSDLVDRPMTRIASQAMSPIRAQHSTDVDPGVANTTVENSANRDRGGSSLAENATTRNDATLSHEEAEDLILSLADIPGGRPLFQTLLQNLNRSTTEGFETEPDSPPLANSQDSSQRDFSFPGNLDNMNPGGRYDNAELSSYTKVLINSPSIKLPKLQARVTTRPGKSEVPLHFEQHMLADITYGVERYDEAEGLRPLSLSVDLRTTFKIDDIRKHMDAAAMLIARITQRFEAGDGVNPDYLLQDLVTRKLQPNESVTTYVEDIARKVTQLH
ncbi:hypothetical protein PHMEG_00034428 [Phytophthora megakarya]|uniref:Uncharacterized protein n=1 Tax=Phytophthora megakarya TaxID=4795 RepID=A0A225UR85_9STRA|nr:hypothetical protein PHMEG_00034428 [Phytophthora megakarya]